MWPAPGGSIRLFRLAGIDVFLHWSWFVVALYEVQKRRGQYSMPVWNVLEYLALFAIVTLHEFGHSLACRQTGGTANQIVLWPLGGVAYVKSPPRPGATLWSLSAGPLVNVLLVPLLLGADRIVGLMGGAATFPDASRFVATVRTANLVLLIFNLLPVYPLDGGQILRSVLWFGLGQARSLAAATIVGFLGVLGLIALAVRLRSPWIGLLAIFMGFRCWSGLQRALALSRGARLPRHLAFACPSCRTPPPIGPFWGCDQCHQAFDTFAAGATCPTCGTAFALTSCVECGRQHPIGDWAKASPESRRPNSQ